MARRTLDVVESYPLPTAVYLDRKRLQDLGSRMAGIVSLEATPKDAEAAYSQLESVIRSLGGRINRIGFIDLALREMCSGSIEIHSEDDFDIFLPREDEVGPIFARETLAHELGHYVLHHPLSPSGTMRANHLGANSDLSDDVQQTLLQAEREATWFAEGLLAPTKALQELFKSGLSDTVDVARHLHTSEQTVKNRWHCIT